MTAAQRVLAIIDDDISITTHFGGFFNRQGFLAHTFSEGSNLLEWLGKNHCDLLLVDFHMPGLDGFTLLCMLKERFPKLHVFILSGMVWSSEEIEGMQAAGAAGVIRKTAPLDEILERVVNVVTSKPARKRIKMNPRPKD